jgi:hypothetical protein
MTLAAGTAPATNGTYQPFENRLKGGAADGPEVLCGKAIGVG